MKTCSTRTRHYAKGCAHFDRCEFAEALKAFRAAVEADPKMIMAWFGISGAEFAMNGGKPCEAMYVPLSRCIKLDPNTGAVLANKTLAPNAMAKKIAEWFMVTCEKAGADAKEL